MSSDKKIAQLLLRLDPKPPAWAMAALLGAAYFACAKVSVFFSVKASPFITFWLPTGLYMGALLLSEYRLWPWLVSGAMAGNFTFDLNLGTKFGLIIFFFSSNTAIATTGALLMRKFVNERPVLLSLKELAGLFALGAGVGAGLGSLIGAAGLMVFHDSDSFFGSWMVFWADDAMAIMLLTSLLLAWGGGAQRQSRISRQPAKLAEAIVLVVGLAVATRHAFAPGTLGLMSPYKFQIIPFLLWAGLRFGTRGATAVTFAAALMMAHFVSRQLDAQTANSSVLDEQVFTLQGILIVAAMVALIPAVVLEERDRTLKSLRESEEKFSKAFRTGPDAMSIKDLETGRYLEVNEAFEKTYGFQRAEVIGKSLLEIGAKKPSDECTRQIAALKYLGPVRDLEIQSRRPDGKILTLLYSTERIELGGRPCELSVSHDITDRKNAEQALRATVEHTPNVAIQWFDLEGRVVFWNQASEKIYGWTADEALGKTLDQLILTPELNDFFIKTLGQIAANGQPVGPVEFPVHHRNGSPGIVLSTVFKISADGGQMRFVCMDVDITERKRAEAERELSVAREQKARIEYTLQLIAAQEAERTRIARELHDSLGQNLLLVKNRAQMALLPEFTNGKWQEQVEKIISLATLAINEVRQISRDLHPYQLDHLGLTHALAVMIEEAAQSSSIAFDKKIEDVDDVLGADAAMNFYRVLQESLNNILKHSRAKNVTVRLERDLHELQLLVTDDGCGFEAADASYSEKGLGLKNIGERMRMLGGKFRLDSQPGHGTRLEATVPIAPRSA